MFVLAYIVRGLAEVLRLGLSLFYWVIILRAILSWVNPDPLNPFVRFLRQISDPVLEPLRRVLHPMTARFGIDLSPLLAIFLILFLQTALVGMLSHLADVLMAV